MSKTIRGVTALNWFAAIVTAVAANAASNETDVVSNMVVLSKQGSWQKVVSEWKGNDPKSLRLQHLAQGYALYIRALIEIASAEPDRTQRQERFREVMTALMGAGNNHRMRSATDEERRPFRATLVLLQGERQEKCAAAEERFGGHASVVRDYREQAVASYVTFTMQGTNVAMSGRLDREVGHAYRRAIVLLVEMDRTDDAKKLIEEYEEVKMRRPNAAVPVEDADRGKPARPSDTK